MFTITPVQLHLRDNIHFLFCKNKKLIFNDQNTNRKLILSKEQLLKSEMKQNTIILPVQ